MKRGQRAKKAVRRAPVVAGRRPRTGPPTQVVVAEPEIAAELPEAAQPEPEAAEPSWQEEPDQPELPMETEPEETPERRPSPLIAALTVVLVLATAFAIWAAVEATTLQPSANTALVDNATTDQVIRQVTDGIRDTFSYDHTDTRRTEQAADRVLAERAIEQYRELFAEVRRVAPEQKLVLTTTIRAAGVREIQGDRAVLLVFVDQQLLRAGDHAQNSGAAQLEVTARREGADWRIVELRVL